MSFPHAATLARIAQDAVAKAMDTKAHPSSWLVDRSSEQQAVSALSQEQIERILDAVDAAVYDTAHDFSATADRQCCGQCDNKGVEGLCDDRLEALNRALAVSG